MWFAEEEFVKRSPRTSSAPGNLPTQSSSALTRTCPGRAKRNHRIGFQEVCLQEARAALVLAVVLVPMIFASQAAQAQTYKVLYSFKGTPDGKNPWAELIRDAKGNLYGTTSRGGVSYWGTAFKLDPRGKETVLYNFLGGYGELPMSGLTRDAKGNFYGTTSQGGFYGRGTAFKLDMRGNETVLYSFGGGALSGGLALDGAGNLYGTAGTTVFKLDKAGKLTVLHFFSGPPDGEYPSGGVVRDAEGNLYGTTYMGGAYKYYGTVFKIDKTSKETVLHSFSGPDGSSPLATVILDADGNLYGVTSSGGTSGNCNPFGCGVVFKLAPHSDGSWTETVLYNFAGQPDGSDPVGTLVRDAGGNLYGMTASGGSSGAGTVFKLDTTGKETVLHSFAGGADGWFPQAGLLLDDEGNLYGTTSDAVYGTGTVFELTP